MSSEPDGVLIQRAKEQVSAFGALYERHVDRVFGYVLARVGDPAEAEDVTARVFLQALTHLPGYTDRGAPFSAWLFRIAHNLVANWHRERERRQRALGEMLRQELDRTSERLEALTRHDALVQLRNALQSLPLDRQRLLTLKFVDDLSNAEIGRLMGRSEGAIKALLHRTVATLRRALRTMDDALA
ncbi:MAG: sigma-70 family RNA polymerase sigma factor [Chloroflexota bacterium]|nr:sigma-70 family RNA polymerase sigma factor [Dehalococcoidia bacterium]MDW8252635.1 sigma-70 family RNA polymerase sigma factor [Chloroflexota bacterium]